MMRISRNNTASLPITVAIPVRNEEANLPRCLERLKRFADVVVIDSGSIDRTREIAQRFGVRVIDFRWDGNYPKKRNWFLTNFPPHQPWVLFLDADEFVDDQFCDVLAEVLPRTDCDGFWLTYRNVFLGRELRHGLQQRKLALFRVGKGLYERIQEEDWSSLDMEIHEHPIIEGKVGWIRHAIEHHDFKGLASFIARHREYALWEARRYATLRITPEAWTNFTARQRFKYRNLERWWYPSIYFLFSYIIKRGFLDGSPGFNYALYKAHYFQTIRLLIIENQNKVSVNIPKIDR